MSISGQNLSIVIVTLKSEQVIHRCIKSINHNVPIIVVENSDNEKFKNDLETKYKNVQCVLSRQNLGMGPGNNLGIKLTKTDFVFIMNPDTILETNTLEEIFLATNTLRDFSIVAPISSDPNYPNYGKYDKKKISKENVPFKVDYIDGFAMILNKKKFINDNYFDENIFMYLENDDLCRRVNRKGGSIYIIPKAIINHAGAKAVDSRFSEEVELSRNWHWIWSKFYFNKKNFGIFSAVRSGLPSYCSSIIKFLFFSILGNSFKKRKYFNRASGFYNAFIGKSSWYRPNLKD
tara:strand:- start:11 stop:883 length:873 start_codon:yes stop_codon:yes gene_type:complete